MVVRTGFSYFATTTGVSVNRPGISIRWQEKDFVSSSASMTSASTSGGVGTTSSVVSSTSTGSPAPASKSSSSSLSTGAKVGVGVGVSIAALLLISIVIFFIFRRRRRNSSSTSKLDTGDIGGQPPVQHGSEGFVKPELDASPGTAKFEIGDGNGKEGVLSEVDGKNVLSEMSGREKVELVGSRPPVYEMDAGEVGGNGGKR